MRTLQEWMQCMYVSLNVCVYVYIYVEGQVFSKIANVLQRLTLVVYHCV
jgi:hypothetical protein